MYPAWERRGALPSEYGDLPAPVIEAFAVVGNEIALIEEEERQKSDEKAKLAALGSPRLEP